MLEPIKIGEYSLEFVDFLILFLIGYVTIRWLRHAIFGSADELERKIIENSSKSEAVENRDLNLDELKEFSGQEDRPSYVAFNGNIYDVSKSSALFRSRDFRHLIGTDATEQLILSLTEEKKGEQYESALEYWEGFLDRKYTKIGNLI
ncbi:hypothetical protein WR25_03777 [Diploscapter pachys]|uniref:Cytochrome b5 heme-binding domain-containing protein n=1 Tax=Diploscapter pachys TaxID=2018661 RepID=A0A2A2LNC9_9BILA|nr:hypothetical protein WR25_03777 [Diploscapter pachys]